MGEIDLERIGGEVEKQLAEIRAQEDKPPAELKPANPAHDTRLIPRKIDVYQHEGVEIHETSNLKEVIAAYLHKKAGHPPTDQWESLHYQLLEKDAAAAEGLLEELSRKDEELMARLANITLRRDQIKQAKARNLPRVPMLTPAEVNQRDYWMSVTFDELSDSAPPDFPYPVADLCQ